GSRRRGKGGGAADAGRRTLRGAGGGVDCLLQPTTLAAEGTALDRFRGAVAPAADGEALQEAAARPLLGQQELADRLALSFRGSRSGTGNLAPQLLDSGRASFRERPGRSGGLDFLRGYAGLAIEHQQRDIPGDDTPRRDDARPGKGVIGAAEQ